MSLSKHLSFHLAFALFIAMLAGSTVSAKTKKDATILFYGNSMVERLLEHGELEARLQLSDPKAKIQIRSLAWTGDEVGHRLRLEGYPKHLKKLLAEWPASTIVLGYGLNESFNGEDGLADFQTQYQIHLNQLNQQHPDAQFVLLSPIAIEGNSPEAQKNVAHYSQAIATIASANKAQFIDCFTPTNNAYQKSSAPLTQNGIHLNENGNRLLASIIAEALGGQEATFAPHDHFLAVSQAASEKHRRVAEIVRPKNAVAYFGVRARSKEYNEEMPRYHEMIRLTEENLHRLVNNPKLRFKDLPNPSLPPLPERKGKGDGKRTGIIKSVAEAQAEFKTADDFEVNIFASEEQFPELRNPVQIAFDAQGRLWVVTMPSFPHTLPGLTPPDRIVILEDTDQDGRADKLTTFMDGLDALDGVAFHRDGVIVSEQPRLWLVKDTDGDSQADTQVELLRGIDVTDSHHGGMIATDPYGDIIFSDGVFHRSQLETPFGVHRGIDATTYRFNSSTGQINTEWQHTTPNPWKTSFDRWGGIFQNYGDGHVYDTTALIWTPLGGYHPFLFANIATYGKGSGSAIVSGPNFPDKYQQSMVSASLLGRYAITLTRFEDKTGRIKGTEPLTLIESPNAAFRPADLAFGMDGALYISDFCSPIIGHAQHAMRDPYWDHDFGRIWRLVHTQKPLSNKWPKIEGAPLEDLCDLLLHPQDLVRKHARIAIRKQGTKALPAIQKWLAALPSTHPQYEQAQLENLFITRGLGKSTPELLEQLLQSKSHRVRGAAVQGIRLQANLLPNAQELLTTVVNDPHPRVQLEVIDAVAHLRPKFPQLETILSDIKPLTKDIKTALTTLELGTEPLKGRSVPVLEVAKDSRLIHWLSFGEDGKQKAEAKNTARKKAPPIGLYRTFLYSEKEQPAIIGVKHLALDVRLNDSLVFSQNSLWSGDQQINVHLKKGLNTVEIFFKKSRKLKHMPPVFIYDPVGQALTDVRYPNNLETLQTGSTEYQKSLADQGTVLRVQAAEGLQFSPKTLTVTPNTKIQLIFENPDIMVHNWVLIAPGSVQEIGALSDQLAAQADGAAKEYLPESELILHASKLLPPKSEQELTFTSPSKPGRYPYLCTFPGHWRVMQGELIVEAKP